MKVENFSLNEIISSYTPKQTGVSFINAYHFTGLLPSQIYEYIQNQEMAFNPDFERLSSGKIYDLYSKNLYDIKQNVSFEKQHDYWKISADNQQIHQRNTFKSINPNWVILAQGNYSFEKIYEIQNVIKNLFYFPFVSEVFIVFSSVLEQSNKYSDVDLIVVSKSFFGLSTITITRFWIKAYFKLINRDVHPFIIHYALIVSTFLGLTNISKNLSNLYFNYKKNSRTRLDLGLITDESVNLDNYIDQNPVLLGFIARKKVILDLDITKNLVLQNNIFLNSFKFQTSLLLQFFKQFWELISIFFYPFFVLQYFWFWLFNRENINQYVSYKIWHSFTKVGFERDSIVKTGNVVYKLHS
jgi:hypothetical protein